LRRLAFFLAFVCSSVHAQDETGPRRYLNEVFADTVRTGDVIYQEAFNDASGKSEKLTLRVYEPKADTAAKRPLILITPGGGFVKHDDHWMDDFAEPLARAGYVVALNRYRLANSINSADEFYAALAKAHSDQRAAIRYFINDAKAANRYRIDLDNIFIGGHSAGAITSLYTAYLEPSDELPEALQQALRSQGDLNGKGGEHDRFQIRGVINLSGMVGDLNIIDANGPPLLSIHGDRDSVVKIDGVAGQFGSMPIDQRAQTVGISHQFYIVRGGLHNDTSLPVRCPECVPLVRRFVFNHLTQNAN
jgi:dienelactone hydrolase